MKMQLIGSFDDLLKCAAAVSHKRLVVVNPVNAETFEAIADAVKMLHVKCILVGDEKGIRDGLSQLGVQLSEVEITHENDVERVLRTSIMVSKEGRADILMKGSIDTSTMMRAILKEESGLRTGRQMSDIVVLEYAARTENKFVMITDGGMNLAPDLKDKIEIIENAVEVAHALGNRNPKVALLSASEFVLPNLPSTLDAAALAKMNERGQIRGCVVDGPLALDNALSPRAAEEKGIVSPVAGRAEILVAANIESANSLAKSATYFANLPLAHVIVGARVPILISSRADTGRAKLLSVALGILVSDHYKRQQEN